MRSRDFLNQEDLMDHNPAVCLVVTDGVIGAGVCYPSNYVSINALVIKPSV